MGLRNALIVGGMVIVLGGAVSFFHQNNMLKKLAQENVEQKLLIEEQATINQALTVQLEQEIEAVRHQQAIVIELRRQAEVKRESIKTILVKEPCARVPMPRAVIEQLQSKSNNKD
jgi:hypothetical protein